LAEKDGKMKILHVEDDFNFAKAIETRIQDDYPGIEIIHAASYGSAVEELRKQPFDLVVSDFNFPGKNPFYPTGGIDLFRLILDEFPQTPVHYLSSMPAYIEAILEKSKLSMRQMDKIFSKRERREHVEAFGQEYRL
jgi:DNA-binding NarL/FixJ family response regulator